MNKRVRYCFAMLALFGCFSCEQAFIEPSADADDNQTLFDEFWAIFAEKYAMFEIKGVDWDAQREIYRPLVTNAISNDSMFEIFAQMSLQLRDGHVNLTDLNRDSSISFDILKGTPLNYDVDMLSASIGKFRASDAVFFMEDQSAYLQLQNDIGLVVIPTFNARITDSEIDEMLRFFSNTKGLIFDVRNNTGGFPSGSTRLAGHLTSETVETGFERFKTGPGSNDFTDHPAFNVTSTGETYTKPIIVLTNGLCYSATTTFIYQLNPLNHVTFLGSRTGGGSGSVADGFLSNGWQYSLSVSEFIDFENRHLDDGFDPDIEVFIDSADFNTDEVLEAAIDLLNN